MFKIIDISGDDIRLDDRSVSDMITTACRRAGVYIEGIAVLNDRIALICSQNDSGCSYSYHLTRLPEAGFEQLAAELRSRYDNHFRTVGAFELADALWTLTEKKYV